LQLRKGILRRGNNTYRWLILKLKTPLPHYYQGIKEFFLLILVVIKEDSTNEILAHQVSDPITLEIATDTQKNLKENQKVKLKGGDHIHSDQGSHYTI